MHGEGGGGLEKSLSLESSVFLLLSCLSGQKINEATASENRSEEPLNLNISGPGLWQSLRSIGEALAPISRMVLGNRQRVLCRRLVPS